MVRPLRVEFPGAIYHVISRGNNKKDIFKGENDRFIFLKVFTSVLEEHNWLCHAYCLMNNHYHLLIETIDGNLSKGMRQLNGVYTQKFNKLHNMSGHVFGGRYKAILVDKDSYLLELSRYIVLNPVRAHLVYYPWEWKWSSLMSTLGYDNKPSFLNIDWVLSQFGKGYNEARINYRQFIMDGLGKDFSYSLNNPRADFVLAKEDYIKMIKKHIEANQNIKEISRLQRMVGQLNLNEIFGNLKNKKERNKKICIARLKYGYTNKEIADYLNIHYSSVSKIIKGCRDAIKNE